jgi:hypothetical protein
MSFVSEVNLLLKARVGFHSRSAAFVYIFYRLPPILITPPALQLAGNVRQAKEAVGVGSNAIQFFWYAYRNIRHSSRYEA